MKPFALIFLATVFQSKMNTLPLKKKSFIQMILLSRKNINSAFSIMHTVLHTSHAKTANLNISCFQKCVYLDYLVHSFTDYFKTAVDFSKTIKIKKLQFITGNLINNLSKQ